MLKKRAALTYNLIPRLYNPMRQQSLMLRHPALRQSAAAYACCMRLIMTPHSAHQPS
jgi:hypothetical protein